MRIAYVHFYVEDAKTWCDWFVHHLNFRRLDADALRRCFPVSVNTDSHTSTEVVTSGVVSFVLSSAISSISPVAKYLSQHPPGVVDVAFEVDNLPAIIAKAKAHGIKFIKPTVPQYTKDKAYTNQIKLMAWGGLTHTLVQKQFIQNAVEDYSSNAFIQAIDHIVLNVPIGNLQPAVAWYQNILGFREQQKFNIQTEYSALHSQVMVSHDGSVQLPINEPATANSQIQEFLSANQGAGIQHIALQTSDMISNITKFRSRGVAFLPISQNYYSNLQKRTNLPLKPNELVKIAKQEILVDWKEDSPNALLLQIFTKPIFPQPTFFFEFIERRQCARGFGEGNFRALFEAMELEQIKRGSL
ncbi:4-hydroxyphenylpyruvate dioxygenase [Rivularia sp. PCC 7116]|uniref:4-hydroxyphenylpyruvate dioxygenase n=1 Tax=Rivularia sp. PCC 7116 TaxID=373994 RepID=UPI00029EFCDE|nr:4-hydroxyphenylpyruvate dioxygenase [Rivularia sp. PCC 7116]AFY57682.1 4-hydroxyphenylpyruvate dioxygenase [Rivularia sp. PCC 7116]